MSLFFYSRFLTLRGIKKVKEAVIRNDCKQQHTEIKDHIQILQFEWKILKSQSVLKDTK